MDPQLFNASQPKGLVDRWQTTDSGFASETLIRQYHCVHGKYDSITVLGRWYTHGYMYPTLTCTKDKTVCNPGKPQPYEHITSIARVIANLARRAIHRSIH